MKKLGAKDLYNQQKLNNKEANVSSKITNKDNWLNRMGELVKKGTRERQLDWYLKFLINSDSKAVEVNQVILTRINEHPEIKSI